MERREMRYDASQNMLITFVGRRQACGIYQTVTSIDERSSDVTGDVGAVRVSVIEERNCYSSIFDLTYKTEAEYEAKAHV